jgi:lysophospholipase L1-like esterase
MYRYLIMSLALFFFLLPVSPKKRKTCDLPYRRLNRKERNRPGDGGLWGWGAYLHTMFDTSKVSIRNYALGGRSSRTFITQGLWDNVLSMIKPGDYVFIQFGHNDSSPVNDDSRARGTLKGTGEESEEIDNILQKTT